MKSHKNGFYLKCERKNSWLLQSNTAIKLKEHIFFGTYSTVQHHNTTNLYTSHCSWDSKVSVGCTLENLSKCSTSSAFYIMNTLYSDILVICILYSRELRIFKCGDGDALGMLSHKVMAVEAWHIDCVS